MLKGKLLFLVDRHSGCSQHESMDEVGQEEEAKELLQLFPIGATCLTTAAIFSQATTLFTKQASTLDRRIGTGFQVPPASLGSFVAISTIVFIPIYDRVIVPIARNFTGWPTGITMLQRIGTGISLSVIMMVVAALVEMKRLQTARDFGLVDVPDATIPMSIWWLLPLYVLHGITIVFFLIGLQEFFYDQVPDEMRSLGVALHASGQCTLSGAQLGEAIESLTLLSWHQASTGDGRAWCGHSPFLVMRQAVRVKRCRSTSLHFDMVLAWHPVKVTWLCLSLPLKASARTAVVHLEEVLHAGRATARGRGSVYLK